MREAEKAQHPNITSLRASRLKLAEELLRKDETLLAVEPLFELLRGLPVANNSSVELKAWPSFWSGDTPGCLICLRTRDLPVEMAVDLVLGPLHRAFGLLWKMRVDRSSTDFTSTWQTKDSRGKKVPISLQVYVYHSELVTCRLVERVKKVRTDEELEYWRTDRETLFVCEE